MPFWDQLYNLIHVPTMAKLDDIIDAINNLKLDVTVDLDELLDTLNQNHEDQIANDNAIADQIQKAMMILLLYLIMNGSIR